jgi:hypothetical protein
MGAAEDAALVNSAMGGDVAAARTALDAGADKNCDRGVRAGWVS